MQINKQDEKLFQELLKKYKQGIISGLYPGTNITFTPTGCRDKVISSLNSGGGSSSSIFPNGIEMVTESRDFEEADAGKLLVLINASLTMPVGVSILDNKQLGVLTIFNSSTIEVSPNSELTLYSPNNGQSGEILLLENTIQEGQSKLAPISSFNINGKTALKHLMDSLGSNGLFPNGNEFITSSRDYQASDAGKRLFISGATTVLTMPEVSPFVVGDLVGIITEDVDASFTTEFEGQPIYPLKNGDGANSECVVLIATEINSTIKLFSISTAFILDADDNKKKTALKYLYDKANASGGSPAGSDTQVQYNNAGAFGADANFTRDSSGQTLIRAQDVGIQNGTVSVQTGLAAISATDETNYSFTRFRTTPILASGVYFDGISLQNGFNINSNGITLGNLSGGNNTKITIDDVNEQITISNLSAYDDDTAAGVGGLTAGMVYMTTGSGSAPLNAAGILMIKQ